MPQSVDNSAARRQSYSRPAGNKTDKDDIYIFLQDFKLEQVAALEKLTNEVIDLKGRLIETNNEGDKKQIKNKNGIIYAELEFGPIEELKKTKEENILQEKSIYEVPQQQNDVKLSPIEADLRRKVDHLTRENEIYNKRMDVMQNQLNLFQVKLQELKMKENIIKEKDMLVQTTRKCCQKLCYQYFKDLSHTIMALWEGNAHNFLYL